LEFSKRAAIEPEKFEEYRLHDANFLFDLFDRNICKARGKVGKHALEREQFFNRRIAFWRGLRRSVEGYWVWHSLASPSAVTENPF
jgi:hypothetical protein